MRGTGADRIKSLFAFQNSLSVTLRRRRARQRLLYIHLYALCHKHSAEPTLGSEFSPPTAVTGAPKPGTVGVDLRLAFQEIEAVRDVADLIESVADLTNGTRADRDLSNGMGCNFR